MQTVNKIVDLPKAKQLVNEWKTKGEEIVFSNGCFDILHVGHVDYLEKSRQQGDRLVIGLNTDRSVSLIKGPSRPIVDQYSRARIIAAMEFVDLVVLFDEETPLNLITELSPSILVKGKDYNISNIVGADFVLKHGGKVETIELTAGFSSTNVINNILKIK